MPDAASTMFCCVSTTPAYAFVNIGGMPSATSATQVGQKPRPNPYRMLSGKTRAMIANDGIARPRFTIATDSVGASRLWASHTAAGMAADAEIITATNEIQTCAHPRARIPCSPVQFDPVVRNSIVPRMTFIVRAATE